MCLEGSTSATPLHAHRPSASGGGAIGVPQGGRSLWEEEEEEEKEEEEEGNKQGMRRCLYGAVLLWGAPAPGMRKVKQLGPTLPQASNPRSPPPGRTKLGWLRGCMH
ncbi:unnamed protein product [Prorocentrum cordatum]|uniref:Uncharacterized protein n=1 Tax=Prorocentrum cordatum TaxID=2364126 RepID=A0ABN9PL20_9DINO|nr:unnamed protein product [Polarella glacialis]